MDVYHNPPGSTRVLGLGLIWWPSLAVDCRPGDGPNKQEFLQGHADTVSCLAISKSGKFLASGQVTHMGFAAGTLTA